MVAWLENNFTVNILHVSDQCIHLYVNNIAMRKDFTLTVVYAFNDNEGRKSLWKDLSDSHKNVRGAWIISGDFNSPPPFG